MTAPLRPAALGKRSRRWLRRRAWRRFGESVIDRPLMPSLLGFQKAGSGVVDGLGGLRLSYDPRSDIGQTLFLSGTFEELEIRFFEQILSGIERPTVLDIGANLGLHCLRWATSSIEASIYAFEPSPRTLRILRRNIRMNRLEKRIQVIPVALSDHPGNSAFFHCEDDAYSSLRDTHRRPVVESIEVEVTTVDTFVKTRGLPSLNLMKIDVEGLEREVLRGSKRTLELLRPHLFVEVFGGTHSNPDPEGTIEFVKTFGYDAFVLKNGVPEEYARHSDQFYNYYFMPKP